MLRMFLSCFASVALLTLTEGRLLRTIADPVIDTQLIDPRTITNPEDCKALCLPLERPMSKTLPNVFIFGDSVSQDLLGYFNVTADLLHGKASVHGVAGYMVDEPFGVCGSSFGVLHCVDAWLGDGKWDVISFNWGLHDICPTYYKGVTHSEYLENLDALFRALHAKLADGGKMIWQTTTPVPPEVTIRHNKDVLELNKLAEHVFQKTSNPPMVNDLYGAVVDACDTSSLSRCFPKTCGCGLLMDSGNIHMVRRGNDFIGGLVADSILKAMSAVSPRFLPKVDLPSPSVVIGGGGLR